MIQAPCSRQAGSLWAQLVADGGQQAVLRGHRVAAGVQQHEAA